MLYRGLCAPWLHQEYHRGPTEREMQYDSKFSISVADDRTAAPPSASDAAAAAISAALPPAPQLLLNIGSRLLSIIDGMVQIIIQLGDYSSDKTGMKISVFRTNFDNWETLLL